MLCRVIRFPVTSHTTSTILASSSSSYQKSQSKTLAMSHSSNTGGGGGGFKLSESSVLKINKGDITQWFIDGSSSDAIVNPANERMLGGGGADGGLQDHNSEKLAIRSRKSALESAVLPEKQESPHMGFKLPASHVIHTVGPIYDVHSNPAALLRSSYKNSLSVAKENNIQYIAFPAISCGVFGYHFEEAATIAISTIKEFANDFKEVHFVLFADDIYSVWLKKAKELLQAQE
ncbi:hypothetical protein EZV62_025852 [Acer yangbiense]|uniref:Macro domain-containing protein n=1 Tax=Acer yangbiense TaxID=1000413 RepID=A0A5C7GZM6_9ROSI|nr:hypothetical protein EZV62_025852 [Acer yangbiense]